jgi:SOS-response transcriptional repressor LexA
MSKQKRARLGERFEIARRVLAFIRAFFDEHGHSPSLTEIADACFISRTTVLRYLDLLEARGCINRTPAMPRSISLTEDGDCYL